MDVMAKRLQTTCREIDLLDLPGLHAIRIAFESHSRAARGIRILLAASLWMLIFAMAHFFWQMDHPWAASGGVAGSSLIALALLIPWRREALFICGVMLLLMSMICATSRLIVTRGDGFGIRVVPIYYGLPNERAQEKLERGEAIWGGCFLRPETQALIVTLPGEE
ncbi:hypothetical protein JXA47_17155 [Candidatus Sumerlaeota bacterium]|nr:hypothetical protein [Candidatus Sumerlaeota bacterium]